MGDRFGDPFRRPAAHSNTHRPSSQPCEWGRTRVGDAAHDRVVSRRPRIGKGYVRVILLLSGYDKWFLSL
jgi:hypothetical protein